MSIELSEDDGQTLTAYKRETDTSYRSNKKPVASKSNGPFNQSTDSARLLDRRGANLNVDQNVDTCGQIQLLQLIDGGGSWLNNVDQALVGTHFKLIHRLLIDVR